MTRTIRNSLLIGLAVVSTALSFAAPAFAAEDPTCLVQWGELDTSNPPTVRGSFSGCDVTGKLPEIEITENGISVSTVKIYPGKPGFVEQDPHNELILLLDASQSMQGDKFTNALAAAQRLIEQAGKSDRIGLMVFNSDVTTLVKPTTDHEAVSKALGTITLSIGTRMNDAVIKVEKEFSKTATRKIVVLLSDGADQGSKLDEKAMFSKLGNINDVEIFPVGLTGDGFTKDPLVQIAKMTNGEYNEVSSASQLSVVFQDLGRSLLRGFWFEYNMTAKTGTNVKVEMRAKGEPITIHDYRIEAFSKNTQVEITPPPKVAVSTPTIKIPGGRIGQIVVALPFGALVLFVSWLLIESRTRPKIEKRIESFTKRHSVLEASESAKEKRSSLLAPLYALTESMLGTSGIFKRFKFLIEQANLPLREVEVLYMMVAGSIIFLLLGLMLIGGMVSIAIFLPLGGFLPYMWLKRKAKKRKKKFEDQLPDVLSTIAASLKAGHSFNQSINAVIKEAPNPTAEELNRVMTEARLGLPIEDALGSMATRMGSADFDFAVTTVNIQRTVGGSLSEILDMVGDTVRNRQQFRKKVKALTSMGSMSAYVLLGMPIFMMGVLSLLNKTYMAPLFFSSTGHKMLIAGAFFMLLGWAACMKIVAIKT